MGAIAPVSQSACICVHEYIELTETFESMELGEQQL